MARLPRYPLVLSGDVCQPVTSERGAVANRDELALFSPPGLLMQEIQTAEKILSSIIAYSAVLSDNLILVSILYINPPGGARRVWEGTV